MRDSARVLTYGKESRDNVYDGDQYGTIMG